MKHELLSKLMSGYMTNFVVKYAKILDNDLTSSQYFILQTLAWEGPQTSTYFAGQLDVTMPAITNLTNKLVNKGYIERRSAESDRRKVILHITDQGMAFEQKMLDKYKELTDGLWSEFSEEEMDLLIASYQKMLKHLNQPKDPSQSDN
ncbi:MarR family transcriptional regulator [Paenibacillus urinalis]|uniref:MarR family transcriptional regulator n=1 Tax=Paenibacillus urinalis TaxID=521520 RepID=A0AAX3N3Z6_9BACL|nr:MULTISPECIES: MarR family transcriptional regulator [Paenibacillus]WDH83933.1 MarR family transcriptional regulator [Paenibacillus urinalis]WDH95391.1 MarR family transcriptional regulator [Paenibacillus urinalis]WDI03587.1 MarR family transcriptional regulator [Paenibacillus urinalis]